MGAARKLMKGPNQNGPPSASLRKTAVTNVTNGVFSLYVCERTNSVIWVPTGDFFVSDKPKETIGTSVLDYAEPKNPRFWAPEKNKYIPPKYKKFCTSVINRSTQTKTSWFRK